VWYTDDTHMPLGMAESRVERRGFDGNYMAAIITRKYPLHQGFFVACGLENRVQYLDRWHFGPEAIAVLHRANLSPPISWTP
jgi:nicotinic acid phosphoribosyltransferase